MKTASKILMLVAVFLLGFLGTQYLIKLFIEEANKPQPMLHDRVVYLRDSLQMEWYKKQLDTTYVFEHSKIPSK